MSSEIAQRYTNIILFLIGFFVFSPLSSYLLIDILHFPISLPEILLIPFIPFLIKRFKFRHFNWKLFFLLFLCWLLVMAISLITGKYPLYSLVGSARTYLYIIFFFVLFSRKSHFTPKDMCMVCIGTIIGWLINTIICFTTLTLASNEMGIVYGPMLCIPLSFCFLSTIKRRKLAYIILIIGIIIGVLGMLRRVIAISLITAALMMAFYMFFNKREFSRMALVLTSMLLVMILNWFAFGKIAKDVSAILYVRIIDKTESFINGKVGKADTLRNGFIDEIQDNIVNYLVPQGFVSKQNSNGGSETGWYIDLPIAELLHVFSLIPTIVILLYFSTRFIIIISKIKRHKLPQIYATILIGFADIIILLFLEGSFLSFPYMAVFTGYILGALTLYSKPILNRDNVLSTSKTLLLT